MVTLLGGSGGVVKSLDLPASLKSLGVCFCVFCLILRVLTFFTIDGVHYIRHPVNRACTT